MPARLNSLTTCSQRGKARQSRNPNYSTTDFTGSVLKVLQKEEGHGSHWDVFNNPVKRKAKP
jgi:hypothetical protein